VYAAGLPREDIFITSKLAMCGGGTQGYKEALAQQVLNLKEMQLEYTDLVRCVQVVCVRGRKGGCPGL
jgi:diketogulonate reductase-like aldo/keto reductase